MHARQSFLAEYSAEMDALGSHPAKDVINLLSMLADDFKHSAPAIVGVIHSKISSVQPNFKLPIIYTIDSILKNVRGAYRSAFHAVIVNLFTDAFLAVDGKSRGSMLRVLKTWTEMHIFPAATTTKLGQLSLDAPMSNTLHASAPYVPPQSISNTLHNPAAFVPPLRQYPTQQQYQHQAHQQQFQQQQHQHQTQQFQQQHHQQQNQYQQHQFQHTMVNTAPMTIYPATIQNPTAVQMYPSHSSHIGYTTQNHHITAPQLQMTTSSQMSPRGPGEQHLAIMLQQMYESMRVPIAQRMPLAQLQYSNPGLYNQLLQHSQYGKQQQNSNLSYTTPMVNINSSSVRMPEVAPVLQIPGQNVVVSSQQTEMNRNMSVMGSNSTPVANVQNIQNPMLINSTEQKNNPTQTTAIEIENNGNKKSVTDLLLDRLHPKDKIICRIDGLRFKTEEEHARHLDWYFRANRRKTNGQSCSARMWFVGENSWAGGIALASVEEKSETVAASFFDVQAAEAAAAEEKHSGQKSSSSNEVERELDKLYNRVPGSNGCPLDENFKTCPVCGEQFERHWWEVKQNISTSESPGGGNSSDNPGDQSPGKHTGNSQWIWKNTVRPPPSYGNARGQIYHRDCFESLASSPVPKKTMPMEDKEKVPVMSPLWDVNDDADGERSQEGDILDSNTQESQEKDNTNDTTVNNEETQNNNDSNDTNDITNNSAVEKKRKCSDSNDSAENNLEGEEKIKVENTLNNNGGTKPSTKRIRRKRQKLQRY